jgi:hypothetical protein
MNTRRRLVSNRPTPTTWEEKQYLTRDAATHSNNFAHSLVGKDDSVDELIILSIAIWPVLSGL